MQYMLLIFSDPSAAPATNSPEAYAEFGEWMRYTETLKASGDHVSGEPLQAVETATTVSVRNGETLLADGPFVETKEHLVGYYVIDVADLDAAIAWASKMPNIAYGSVEVRPLMVIPSQV